MTMQRRTLVVRDQDASPFSSILLRLCDATGAHGAAFVDAQGETVDYAGTMSPFEIRVAAAELRILLQELQQGTNPTLATSQELTIRTNRCTYFARALSAGYALTMRLPKRCFNVSPRALEEATRELCREGGLPARSGFQSERWSRIDVQTGTNRRPVAVWQNGKWCSLEILGRLYRRAPTPETGYRVRLDTGAETTLVRELLGAWYGADMADR